MSDNLAYQEEPWEELIDGKVVAMSPRPVFDHNIVAGNIFRIFGNYLHGKKCTAISDGMDLYLTEKDRFVPDMMVVCDPGKIKRRGVYGAPDLVVEVLSPSTARYDRIHKKKVYEQCGVREYWIVNLLSRDIEQYFLQDGKLELNNVYHDYEDWELEDLSDEERTAAVAPFKCSLFDDLEISMEYIFSGLLPQ